MFLKGGLCESLSEEDRSNLKRTWKKFKREIGDDSLDRFDRVVSEVHKYETVRYPENIVSRGMLATIQWAREDAVAETVGSEPRYPWLSRISTRS
jgi:hypothetical protein